MSFETGHLKKTLSELEERCATLRGFL